MAKALVFAIASNADGQKKRKRGKQIDDLTACRRFHLILVESGEGGETDFLLPVLRDEIGCGSQERNPLIKVTATLPIFASNPTRNMASDAETQTFIRLPWRTVAISRNPKLHQDGGSGNW